MGLHQTNKVLRVREATKSKETDCRVRENIVNLYLQKDESSKFIKNSDISNK
jgi:hypothetical protein